MSHWTYPISVLYTEEAWNKSNDLNPKSLVESECLVPSLKEPIHKAILFSPIVWVWTGISIKCTGCWMDAVCSMAYYSFLFSLIIFRIRTHAIKFMEMLVLVQSLKTQVGFLFFFCDCISFSLSELNLPERALNCRG